VEGNEFWSDDDDMAFITSVTQGNSTDKPSENTRSPYSPLLKLLFFSVILWQLSYSISDAAVKVIIATLKKFLSILSRIMNCGELKNAVDSVPNAYKALLKYVGLECPNTTLYVVCPSCGCVYNFGQCTETRAGKNKALNCKFVAFPNHSHQDQREPCNSPLLKEVKVGSQKKSVFVPIKAYPYQGLKAGITDLVSNPEFLSLCDHWRNGRQEVPEGV